MKALLQYLDWFTGRDRAMAERVAQWCRYRTGSHDVAALQALAEVLKASFAELQAIHEVHALPPWETWNAQGTSVQKPLGPALIWRKRPEALLQVMLAVHTDVVYAESEIDNDSLSIRWEGLWLHAPGAADAKGGIAVIRETLLALEASPWAANIGWRVILNPDEEIGSPGSSELLRREAAECDFALLFEPSLPDGALVGQRKGSGNFVLHMAGRAAHAGRNPEAGRNAIHALAEVVTALASLAKPEAGLTVNVGSIAGGGSVNRVPDSATAQVNIRVTQVEQQSEVLRYLDELKAKWGKREGFALQWRGGFTAPPKLMADATETVMQQVLSCAQALGMDLVVRPSGGVCDGNRLAAAGLPNVDTLGPRGEGLHGAGEKLFLPSLVERARLATLVLLTAASGNWRPPRRNG